MKIRSGFFLSFFQIAWGLCVSLSLVSGYYYLGHIPTNLIDHDKTFFISSIFTSICLFLTIVCFFTTPIWLILFINSLFENKKISKTEILLNGLSFFSIILFFLFKYQFRHQFLWIYD